MKRIVNYLFIIICLLGLSSCNDNRKLNAKMIFDFYIDGRNLNISEVILPEFPDKELTVENLNTLVPGNIMSLYTCDFTGDGYPELCIGSSWGSGYINESITIIDYKNDKTIFMLGERFSNDVYFRLKDEELWIIETLPMERDKITRKGKLVYLNNKICVEYE